MAIFTNSITNNGGLVIDPKKQGAPVANGPCMNNTVLLMTQLDNGRGVLIDVKSMKMTTWNEREIYVAGLISSLV